jgi:hypothetical protein
MRPELAQPRHGITDSGVNGLLPQGGKIPPMKWTGLRRPGPRNARRLAPPPSAPPHLHHAPELQLLEG